jgi:hypothetical protein
MLFVVVQVAVGVAARATPFMAQEVMVVALVIVLALLVVRLATLVVLVILASVTLDLAVEVVVLMLPQPVQVVQEVRRVEGEVGVVLPLTAVLLVTVERVLAAKSG